MFFMKIKANTSTTAIIELVNGDHVVCRLPDYKNVIALAPLTQVSNL